MEAVKCANSLYSSIVDRVYLDNIGGGGAELGAVAICWLKSRNVRIPGVSDPDLTVGMKTAAPGSRYSSVACPVQQACMCRAAIGVRAAMIGDFPVPASHPGLANCAVIQCRTIQLVCVQVDDDLIAVFNEFRIAGFCPPFFQLDDFFIGDRQPLLRSRRHSAILLFSLHSALRGAFACRWL